MSSMLRNRLLLLLMLASVAAGCDNIGRAFDNNVDPSDPGEDTGISTVQVVPVGGDARDGRPQVRATYPEGAGWPAEVPIVVEFSESINEATLLPTTTGGIDGRIGVRVQGTQQLFPAQYDVIANGRLLVIRPVSALTLADAIYEVVLFPEGRDVDGVRFQVTGDETILSDFQTNQDESIRDGRILAIYPRDNFGEQSREGDFFVVFDRAANLGTINSSNLFVQQAGATVAATPAPVLQGVGGLDTRVVRLRPDMPLVASSRFDFSVTSAVTFPQGGTLDFNGRTPFSVFDTVGPTRPVKVELGNPSTGFENQINTANVLNATLAVELPADTLTGDLVVGRIYGGDASTMQQTFDIAFVERTVTAPVDGAQTVQIEFGGDLGTLANPALDDGDIRFAVKTERGGESTGFIQNDETDEPRFDITPPELSEAGPPGSGVDIYTDNESLTFYGNASEELAVATLEDGVNPTANLFAASRSGRFLMQPVALGRLTAPRGYTLTLTDLAGNLSATAIAGNIVQRGQITGTLAGMLTVEAYDEVTLLPIAGATVLVDPPTPTVPATAQLDGETDASGRSVFTSGLGAGHTITIVRAGYDLVTLYDTRASFVSLPLRPLSGASSSLIGTASEVQAPTGETAIVSSTAAFDRSMLGVATTSAAPTSIPPTPIVANRPQVLTAFGGNFEPTAKPTYEAQGCQICGPTLTEPTVPLAPGGPGDDVSGTIVLTPAVEPRGFLAGPHPENFGLAVGLDLANLVGGIPRVRVTASLAGFSGQVVTGIGFATLTGGSTFDLDANFALPLIAGFAPFAPVSWLAAEAEDTSGRVSRVRVLLNPTTGTIIAGSGPSPIPTIVPIASATGSPAVSFVDAINPLPVPGGFGMSEVIATDASGRRWVVMVADRDVAGATRMVQFPDLATPLVAGLEAGTWDVVVESRLAISLTASSIDDFVLAERFRQEVNYVRSASVTATVQ